MRVEDWVEIPIPGSNGKSTTGGWPAEVVFSRVLLRLVTQASGTRWYDGPQGFSPRLRTVEIPVVGPAPETSCVLLRKVLASETPDSEVPAEGEWSGTPNEAAELIRVVGDFVAAIYCGLQPLERGCHFATQDPGLEAVLRSTSRGALPGRPPFSEARARQTAPGIGAYHHLAAVQDSRNRVRHEQGVAMADADQDAWRFRERRAAFCAVILDLFWNAAGSVPDGHMGVGPGIGPDTDLACCDPRRSPGGEPTKSANLIRTAERWRFSAPMPPCCCGCQVAETRAPDAKAIAPGTREQEGHCGDDAG